MDRARQRHAFGVLAAVAILLGGCGSLVSPSFDLLGGKPLTQYYTAGLNFQGRYETIDATARIDLPTPQGQVLTYDPPATPIDPAGLGIDLDADLRWTTSCIDKLSGNLEGQVYLSGTSETLWESPLGSSFDLDLSTGGAHFAFVAELTPEQKTAALSGTIVVGVRVQGPLHVEPSQADYCYDHNGYFRGQINLELTLNRLVAKANLF